MPGKSLEEVHASVDTTQQQSFFKKLLAFMGPAYLISVGYVDPGNWATDLAAGSQFGYRLIWVLLMSNIMAVLLQSLSARLGIVSGRDLAQACRENYPAIVNYSLYFLAEIAIIATDLAEVIGMAIGLNLLFQIPLIWGIIITFLDTFLLLFLINKGIRKMEAFILALLFIISISFMAEMFLAQPDMHQIIKGFVPDIPNKDALYIALGIIGATVMPHNLYLHSSLVQTRKFNTGHKHIKDAIRFNIIDSIIALNLAFFVNAAILILAAATFYKAGLYQIAEIQDAYRLLEPLLGSKWAPVLFGLALIAAGQSSTITGTLAGQIVMEGFINLRIQAWIRRIITRLLAILPAIAVIVFWGENYTGKLLIFSQVILSLQLGFAVIPLIHFVSNRSYMGKFAIGIYTKIIAWTIALIIIGLNSILVYNEIHNWITQKNPGLLASSLIFTTITLLIILLIYISLKTIVNKNKLKNLSTHQREEITPDFHPVEYNKIAIAVDFSTIDQLILNHALALGTKKAKFLLIHIVESVPAIYFGDESNDYESKKDFIILEGYADQIKALGYEVSIKIGYGNPKSSIPKITTEFEADILILGSHGHKIIKDLLFGTTISAVRHQIKIPVMVIQ